VHQKEMFAGFQDLPLIFIENASEMRESCYVMSKEYFSDLFDWIVKNPPNLNSPKENLFRIQLCKQLMQILKRLVDLGVCHLDQKADNYLVDEPKTGEFTLKLIDFEIMKKFEDFQWGIGFPVTSITSHEDARILQEESEKSIDQFPNKTEEVLRLALQRELFATGLLMYALLFGFPPYATKKDGKDTFAHGEMYSKDLDKYGYPQPIVDLVKQMILLDPDKRIACKDAIAAWEKF
jgi:serine/threonine protein kinase